MLISSPLIWDIKFSSSIVSVVSATNILKYIGTLQKMNYKISLFISFFLMVFFFRDTNAFNITKLLDQYPHFSTFNNYLTQTQVASQINSRQTITILAVDNGNISPLSGKPLDVLRKIMSLHVILDYYDVKKLQNLQKRTALITTLYQATGQAVGQQGFLNVTNLSTGTVVFRSAVNSGTPGANLVKSILAEPYNISILQISTVIVPVGGANNSSASSPFPAPAASPDIIPPPEISPSMPPPGQAPSPTAPGLAPAPSDAPSNAPKAGTPATAPTSTDSTPQPAPGSPPVPDAPTANAPSPDSPSDTTTDAGTILTFNLRVLMALVPSTLWLLLAV